MAREILTTPFFCDIGVVSRYIKAWKVGGVKLGVEAGLCAALFLLWERIRGSVRVSKLDCLDIVSLFAR